MSTKLHVGNLASETTAATVSAAFGGDGRQVVSVKLVPTRDPRHSRGFAFVEMGSEADALAAIAALHGATIDGRMVRVARAHPPRSRFDGRVGSVPA